MKPLSAPPSPPGALDRPRGNCEAAVVETNDGGVRVVQVLVLIVNPNQFSPSSLLRTAMSLVRTVSVFLVLSLVLSACVSSSTTSHSGLTSDKILVTKLSHPVNGLSVYEVVQRYRSTWLRKRGSTSINNPVPIKVYLDGTNSPYGSVEALRRIRAINVSSIQHFDAGEAHYRFGLGNVAGAILVQTRSGREGS